MLDWPSFFAGIACAFGISIMFVLFCIRHAKSHPPIRDEQEETELAETRIYWHPSYGRRVE